VLTASAGLLKSAEIRARWCQLRVSAARRPVRFSFCRDHLIGAYDRWPTDLGSTLTLSAVMHERIVRPLSLYFLLGGLEPHEVASVSWTVIAAQIGWARSVQSGRSWWSLTFGPIPRMPPVVN